MLLKICNVIRTFKMHFVLLIIIYNYQKYKLTNIFINRIFPVAHQYLGFAESNNSFTTKCDILYKTFTLVFRRLNWKNSANWLNKKLMIIVKWIQKDIRLRKEKTL